MNNSGLIALIASGVALLATLLSNLSTIRREFGSFSNWILRRRDLRKEREIKLDNLGENQRYLSNAQEQLKSQMKFQNDVSATMLKEILKQKLDRIIIRGYIYSDEIEDIDAMYQLYEAYSNSNGIHERIVRATKLPLKERLD